MSHSTLSRFGYPLMAGLGYQAARGIGNYARSFWPSGSRRRRRYQRTTRRRSSAPRAVRSAYHSRYTPKEVKYLDTQESLLYVSEDNNLEDNIVSIAASDISIGTGSTQVSGAKGRYNKLKMETLLRRAPGFSWCNWRVMLVQAKEDTGGVITATNFANYELNKILANSGGPYLMSPLEKDCSDHYRVLIDKHVSLPAGDSIASYTSSKYFYFQYTFPGLSGVFDVNTGKGLCYWLFIPEETTNQNSQGRHSCFRTTFTDY
jgi:hypothetical protein